MSSPENDRSPKKESTPVYAKYIVWGVCAVIFMVLFREPLTRLMDRASDVKVTKEGVEIKTVSTPVGQVQVSAVSVKSEDISSDGIHGQTYVNRNLRFQISWPGDGNWTARDDLGRALGRRLGLPSNVETPIVILRNEPVGGYRPNIAVVVRPADGKSIRQWVDGIVQDFERQGGTVLSASVDEATQGGFITVERRNELSGTETYHLQRWAVAGGRVYEVSAGQLPPDDELSLQVRGELRTILNSFRIIQ